METFQKVKPLYQKKTLGEVIDFIDGDRGSNYPSEGDFFSSGACLFLNTKNVPSSRFSFEEKMFIDAKKDSVLRKGKLQRGDYVLTTRGTVGNFAYYDESVPYENVRINSGMVILRKKTDALDEGFFRYYLSSTSFSGQVKSRVSGSAQPQLPIRDMVSMEIVLPDPHIQMRIASFLSAYDDLIENNEKRIKALEEMAQLLYTEWFVKFKFPLRLRSGQAGSSSAKASKDKHEKVKMVDSGTEYGKIPEGWEVKKFGEVVYLNPITKILKKENILNIPMEALSNTLHVVDISKATRKDSVSGSKFINGDTLFARITPCMQNGKNGFVNFLSDNEVACGSTEFVVMRPRVLSSAYIYFLARNSDFREAAKLTMVGASGRQRVQSEFFKQYLVLVPDAEVMMMFESKAESHFTQMKILYSQNQTLSKTRDLLIPQLVTGRRELK